MAPWDHPQGQKADKGQSYKVSLISSAEGQWARLGKRGLNTLPAEYSWKLRPCTSPRQQVIKLSPLPVQTHPEQPTIPWSKERWINSCPSYGTSTQQVQRETQNARGDAEISVTSTNSLKQKGTCKNHLQELGCVAMMTNHS